MSSDFLISLLEDSIPALQPESRPHASGLEGLMFNSCRKEELVEASKEWITPETLEQRISMTLNNPSKLYEEPTAS